jgi:hypothetical protein
LGERIASYVHMKTLYWVSRPFGSAQIIAIYDQYTGPSLYMVEPSGQVYVKFSEVNQIRDIMPVRLEKEGRLLKMKLKKLTLRN